MRYSAVLPILLYSPNISALIPLFPTFETWDILGKDFYKHKVKSIFFIRINPICQVNPMMCGLLSFCCICMMVLTFDLRMLTGIMSVYIFVLKEVIELRGCLSNHFLVFGFRNSSRMNFIILISFQVECDF